MALRPRATPPSMPDPTLADSIQVRVWDLPTRIFHWVLALTLVGSVISAKIGGNATPWHFRLGYLVMGLLVFRLLWGLVGGRWSRFASFVYAPRTLLRYLLGRTAAHEHLDVGHNPLGSLSVFALLGLAMLQVATGLVADDEIANTGPLNRFVSSQLASYATGWHKGWGRGILITLVVLHVAAIVFYRVRRKQDLVRPMILGDKALPAGTPASADGLAQRLLAVALAAVCAGLVVWVVRLGS